MIILITGVPGHGKTLYAITLIQKFLQDNRTVYADIDELKIPGVAPAPDDWRDTPNGSVVVYDEAQRRFPGDGKAGVSRWECVNKLDTHRHTGHDIIFITQHPTLLHHMIRKFTGRHSHVERIISSHIANIFTQDKYWDVNDRSERSRSLVTSWKYPRQNFQLYKSATHHTYKAKIPYKLIVLCCLCVALVLPLVWNLSDGSILSVDPVGDLAQAALPDNPPGLPPRPVFWTETPTITPVAGCIGNGRACYCYAKSGRILEIPESQCREILERPLPFGLEIKPRSGS